MLVTPPGCSAPSISFPRPSLFDGERPLDVIHCPFASSAVFAGGIKSALEARGDTETQVVAWAGDGATFDIGLGAVSAAAQRNEDILYVCYDNQAYMNTGNQQSGSTPPGSLTTTGVEEGAREGKDIFWIMMGHEIPYAATATVAYPDDLMEKAQRAYAMRGFRFFHILTPCVAGWRYPAHLTVKVSKLAVQTRVFPLMELADGKLSLLKKGEAKPVEEYLALQGRFRGMDQAGVERIKRAVERRWQRLSWMDGSDRSAGGSDEETIQE